MLDRSLILWFRKSFWCIWWAQGSLIAIKPGSRADASAAHTGTGTIPFGLVRIQESKAKHFLTSCWTTFACSVKDIWSTLTVKKNKTTLNFGKAESRKWTPKLILQRRIFNYQIQNTVLACCSRPSMTREWWDCMEGYTAPTFPQSWYLGTVTWEHRDDTLFASLTRYREGKYYQQNCVYTASLSSNISVGSIHQRNFH